MTEVALGGVRVSLDDQYALCHAQMFIEPANLALAIAQSEGRAAAPDRDGHGSRARHELPVWQTEQSRQARQRLPACCLTPSAKPHGIKALRDLNGVYGAWHSACKNASGTRWRAKWPTAGAPSARARPPPPIEPGSIRIGLDADQAAPGLAFLA